MFGIKKAYCLCLDKREEHWLDLKSQCEGKGLEFNRFLVGKGEISDPDEYDRIDLDEPPIDRWSYGGHASNTVEETKIKRSHHCNAFLSHQAMAKKALEGGDEKVLFLEDDAYFTNRFDDVVSQLEDTILELEYDMLYLGWWIGDEGDEFNNKVEKIWNEEGSAGTGDVSGVGGLHGVILSRGVLDAITRLDPIDPIDAQFNAFFHKYIKSYFIAPKIIHDKGIFSECEQSITERHKL